LSTFSARGNELKIYNFNLEAFYFSANLRLSLSKTEISKRVETLINELGLSKCANTRIGNNLRRGVSGGERKRASIGVELLTNPSLIFLDEPTTG
jgi:ABC-type multidrug transport system ATPase subunit